MDPYEHLFRRSDRGARVAAAAATLGVHLLLALLAFLYVLPAARAPTETPPVITFHEMPVLAPPPRPELEVRPITEITQHIPLPVLDDPDGPQPIVEHALAALPAFDVRLDAAPGGPVVGPPPNSSIIGEHEVDRKPELIEGTRVQPSYPGVCRRAGIDGKVVLMVIIGRDGTVRQGRVLREPRVACGFVEAAEDAVSQWRYLPGVHRGKPVEVYMTVVIDFRLD